MKICIMSSNREIWFCIGTEEGRQVWKEGENVGGRQGHIKKMTRDFSSAFLVPSAHSRSLRFQSSGDPLSTSPNQPLPCGLLSPSGVLPPTSHSSWRFPPTPLEGLSPYLEDSGSESPDLSGCSAPRSLFELGEHRWPQPTLRICFVPAICLSARQTPYGQ